MKVAQNQLHFRRGKYKWRSQTGEQSHTKAEHQQTKEQIKKGEVAYEFEALRRTPTHTHWEDHLVHQEPHLEKTQVVVTLSKAGEILT